MISSLIVFQAILMKATVSFAAEDNSSSLSAYLVTRENKHLASHVVKQFESPSLIACSQSCLRNSWCTSTNFKKSAGLDDKATCELNKHEFHAINDDTNLIDQPGTIFSMFLKGCLKSGCLNGGSCSFNKKEESFTCSCKRPWSGHKCEVVNVPECLNYQTLTSSNRKVTHNSSSPFLCDNSLGPGWFRFQGNAGTKMPTSCVSPYRCGTDSTGWLNGTHPTVQEGNVTRQVCFSWGSNCCDWSINIQALNCGPYYLFFISGTPPEHPCHLRYCGTD